MINDNVNEFNQESKEIGKRLVLLSKKINEHQESDPPVLEINDIMFDISNMLSKDIEINKRPSDLSVVIEEKFGEVMKLVIPKLISPKLNAHELAAYFIEKMGIIHNNISLGNDEMKSTMNIITNTNMFIHQKINRMSGIDDERVIVYDDFSEYREIGLMCEVTDLKGTSQRLVDEIDDAYMKNLQDFNTARTVRLNTETARRLN